MKIVCNHCGAEFDSSEMQSGKCPYCGSSVQEGGTQNVESSQGTDPDTFFEDIILEETQPVYVPVTPEYHCSFGNDGRANKAAKDVFGCTITLFVLSILRMLGAFITLVSLSESSDALANYAGTELYYPLKNYIVLGYAEVVFQVMILAVAIALFVLELKVRRVRFPLSDVSAFDGFKKVAYAAIAMTALVVAFFFVEIFVLRSANEIGVDLTLGASTFTGVFILLGCSLGVLINAIKLSKEKQ